MINIIKSTCKSSKVSAVTSPLSIFKSDVTMHLEDNSLRRMRFVDGDWNTFDKLFEYDIQGVLLQPFQVDEGQL